MEVGSVRAAAVALAVWSAVAVAQDVPGNLALMVMLKVLTYDVNFAARGTKEFVVLVPYAKGSEARANDTIAMAEAMDLQAINGRALKYLPVPVADVAGAKASAVLLHAGMSLEVAREVLAVAARARWYSLAFDEALVRDGAMLGVVSNGGRPQVVVNVPTARSIGAELGPAVLRVAKAIQ